MSSISLSNRLCDPHRAAAMPYAKNKVERNSLNREFDQTEIMKKLFMSRFANKVTFKPFVPIILALK